MIDIQVLDSNFELVGVIDTYDSFIWTERYNSCGDFELYSKFNQNILSTIKTDYYLSIPDSDRLMVVETIGLEHDYENGSIIKVQGRSIESLLDRRVIWDPLLIENVGLGSAIKTILIKSIINPDNVDRKVDGFIFSEPVPQVVEDIEIESTQLFGENLYEVISTLCQKYRVGYKLILDENKHLVFSLYFGADRSYEQDTYPVVIFSSEFDNLLNSQYAESVVNYKNACLVLGEGDGNDKTKVEVKTPGAVYTGLNRREMCISESIGTDGETTTNDNYPLQLYQRGTDALSENKVESDYNGQIDPTRIYIFEQDYNLGDLVETVNDFNLSKKARVVEYIRSYASDGINYYPAFAYDEESEEETTYNVISFNVYNARQAVEDAERAADAASVAEDAAVDAAASALAAQGSASTAATAATNAQASAGNAQAAASAAQGSASNAAASASNAENSARDANIAANGALTQLSVVEQVLDVLNWITEHGTYTLTSDTAIDPNKTYFIKDGNNYIPVVNPDASQLSNYYELEIDEALSNYISTHLALTNDGLYVIKDNQSYKVLITNNSVKIQNELGVTIAEYGQNITFSENVAQYIGGENAYIVFNPTDGTLTIGGDSVVFGGKTLSELFTEITNAQSTAENAEEQAAITSTEINGELYYQYTPAGGTTTYDVYKENERYYYILDGVATEVSYDDLDKEDGELVTVYKGGINQNLDDLQGQLDVITGAIVINPDIPSITIKTESSSNNTAAQTVFTENRISFQKIINGEPIEVLYIDSTENEGVIDINNARLRNSLRIGELELFNLNGGIGVRRT